MATSSKTKGSSFRSNAAGKIVIAQAPANAQTKAAADAGATRPSRSDSVANSYEPPSRCRKCQPACSFQARLPVLPAAARRTMQALESSLRHRPPHRPSQPASLQSPAVNKDRSGHPSGTVRLLAINRRINLPHGRNSKPTKQGQNDFC